MSSAIGQIHTREVNLSAPLDPHSIAGDSEKVEKVVKAQFDQAKQIQADRNAGATLAASCFKKSIYKSLMKKVMTGRLILERFFFWIASIEQFPLLSNRSFEDNRLNNMYQGFEDALGLLINKSRKSVAVNSSEGLGGGGAKAQDGLCEEPKNESQEYYYNLGEASAKECIQKNPEQVHQLEDQFYIIGARKMLEVEISALGKRGYPIKAEEKMVYFIEGFFETIEGLQESILSDLTFTESLDTGKKFAKACCNKTTYMGLITEAFHDRGKLIELLNRYVSDSNSVENLFYTIAQNSVSARQIFDATVVGFKEEMEEYFNKRKISFESQFIGIDSLVEAIEGKKPPVKMKKKKLKKKKTQELVFIQPLEEKTVLPQPKVVLKEALPKASEKKGRPNNQKIEKKIAAFQMEVQKVINDGLSQESLVELRKKVEDQRVKVETAEKFLTSVLEDETDTIKSRRDICLRAQHIFSEYTKAIEVAEHEKVVRDEGVRKKTDTKMYDLEQRIAADLKELAIIREERRLEAGCDAAIGYVKLSLCHKNMLERAVMEDENGKLVSLDGAFTLEQIETLKICAIYTLRGPKILTGFTNKTDQRFIAEQITKLMNDNDHTPQDLKKDLALKKLTVQEALKILK